MWVVGGWGWQNWNSRKGTSEFKELSGACFPSPVTLRASVSLPSEVERPWERACRGDTSWKQRRGPAGARKAAELMEAIGSSIPGTLEPRIWQVTCEVSGVSPAQGQGSTPVSHEEPRNSPHLTPSSSVSPAPTTVSPWHSVNKVPFVPAGKAASRCRWTLCWLCWLWVPSGSLSDLGGPGELGRQQQQATSTFL